MGFDNHSHTGSSKQGGFLLWFHEASPSGKRFRALRPRLEQSFVPAIFKHPGVAIPVAIFPSMEADHSLQKARQSTLPLEASSKLRRSKKPFWMSLKTGESPFARFARCALLPQLPLGHRRGKLAQPVCRPGGGCCSVLREPQNKSVSLWFPFEAAVQRLPQTRRSQGEFLLMPGTESVDP